MSTILDHSSKMQLIHLRDWITNHEAQINDVGRGGHNREYARSPTGDDYNALYSQVIAVLDQIVPAKTFTVTLKAFYEFQAASEEEAQILALKALQRDLPNNAPIEIDVDLAKLPDLAATVELMKRQIAEDVRRGIVPATVSSYSELHDHVDANAYGDAFDMPFHPDRSDFWNTAQNTVNAWLQTKPDFNEIAALPSEVCP